MEFKIDKYSCRVAEWLKIANIFCHFSKNQSHTFLLHWHSKYSLRTFSNFGKFQSPFVLLYIKN